jgi:hypothetical protein
MDIEQERNRLNALVDEADKALQEYVKDKRLPNGLLPDAFRKNLAGKILASNFAVALTHLQDFNQKYKPTRKRDNYGHTRTI